jgi:hypothetical protein
MKMQFWFIFVGFIQSGRFRYNDNHFVLAVEARLMWRVELNLLEMSESRGNF